MTQQIGNRILQRLIAAAVLFTTMRCSDGQQPQSCLELNSATKSRLLQIAARQFRTEPLTPAIQVATPVPGTYYTQLTLSMPKQDRPVIVYLSPDGRFLSSALWDLSIDLDAVEARLAADLRQQAKAARAPTRGPGSAQVDLVVFADFQCPFCAVLQGMLERFQKDQPGQIKVVFRNLPLPMHNWAAAAARAGLCIHQQSTKAFWRFHDQIFSLQKGISPDQLPTTVRDFLRSSTDLRADDYENCMASPYVSNRLAQDIAEAHAHDVHATPTVFINGRRYTGFRDEAALKAAISLAISTAPPQ